MGCWSGPALRGALATFRCAPLVGLQLRDKRATNVRHKLFNLTRIGCVAGPGPAGQHPDVCTFLTLSKQSALLAISAREFREIRDASCSCSEA